MMKSCVRAVRLLTGELVKAMPHESGNLSRSVEISLDGIRPVDQDPRATYVDPSAENAATLLQARAGKPVFISIKAPYAVKANYGGDNRQGTFFVLIAANKVARGIAAGGAQCCRQCVSGAFVGKPFGGL
jgi:hypothetical protein